MTDSLALALYGAAKKLHLISQSKSMEPVRLPNLVQPTKIIEDIEQYAGLYGGHSRRVRLQLPEALCFGDEAIQQRVRVPILGAIWKPWRADLGLD